MKSRCISRREMIESCIVKGTLTAGVATLSQRGLLSAWQEAEGSAPASVREEVLGPFYKKGAPNTRVLRQPQDPGFPLRVSGRVRNTRGESLSNASVDLWHTDFYGRYDLEGYRYRAKINPDQDGDYEVETILPGHYPDRPAQHIHYLVRAPGHRGLVTQAYFATDPFFEGDPGKHFGKNGVVEHREHIRPVTLHQGAAGGVAAITFDLVLDEA